MPVKLLEKKLTEEEYKALKPLLPKYETWHFHGSVHLSEEEKQIFRPIYLRLDGINFCNTCQADIIYAFQRVFKAYFATEKPTVKELVCEMFEKKKRKRL